jgi:anti-anti-sigma factor
MEINEELLEGSVYKINLVGRMDIEGVGHIDIKFAGMTASPRRAIVCDLTQVPFMTSLGIRSLVMNAKSVARRGGKMVILSPPPDVAEVLETCGIHQLIPIYPTLAEAVRAVSV